MSTIRKIALVFLVMSLPAIARAQITDPRFCSDTSGGSTPNVNHTLGDMLNGSNRVFCQLRNVDPKLSDLRSNRTGKVWFSEPRKCSTRESWSLSDLCWPQGYIAYGL
jgi:hypothetical protein